MKHTTDTSTSTANDVRLALNEFYADSTHGAVPVIDQYDAFVDCHTIDDEALSEVPQAFAAYLDYQRNQSV